MMMRTSADGLELIKRHEGLELEAYLDAVGVWTIGYGHTGPDAKNGKSITKSKADALLKQDVAQAETAVNTTVRVHLSQNEFDALVSFEFNTGALRKSTLLRKLNAGDRIGAAAEFGRWVHGTVDGKKVKLNGLIRRRAEEAELFLGNEIHHTAGIVAEPPPSNTTPAATAGVAAAAAIAAPVLQAAGSSTPAVILTIAAVLALVALAYWLINR